MVDRVTILTDVIMEYWLHGATVSDEMREWWSSDDAMDTAHDLAEAIQKGLMERHLYLVRIQGPPIPYSAQL